MKVVDNILNGTAKLAVQEDRVLSMDACDQIRTFADINLVFFIPLYPFMISIDG